MHKLYIQKFLICAVIAGLPISTAHAFNNWANDNAAIIGVGIGATVISGAIFWTAATKSSNARYAYKTAEAARKAAENAKQKKDELESARNQKRNEERVHMERAETFIQQFIVLFNKYSNATPEKLANDTEFQRNLMTIVLGTNNDPRRLETLNARITDHKEGLFSINNDTLSEAELNRKKLLLQQFDWIMQQANNSNRIHTTQQELIRQQLEFEHTQHLNHIAAERAMQEKTKTESLINECKHREQAAKVLEQTANELEQQLFKLRGNVQEQLYNIGQSLKERLDTLNAWQANRAQEHAETRQQFHALQAEYARIAQLSATLENACNAIHYLINNLSTLLTRIDGKQDETINRLQTLTQLVQNLPENLGKQYIEQIYATEQRIKQEMNVIHQDMQAAAQQHAQPSAPPMPASKQNGPECEEDIWDASKPAHA